MKKSGIYIKRLRKMAGLTQSEMAKKFGFVQQYIQQLESGTTDISLSKFINMCVVLGYTDYNVLLAEEPTK